MLKTIGLDPLNDFMACKLCKLHLKKALQIKGICWKWKTVYIHTYGHTGIFLCNANSSCTVYTPLGYLLGTTQLPKQMWIIEGAVLFIHLLCHSLSNHRTVTLTLSLVLKIQLELKSTRAVGIFVLFSKVSPSPMNG